MKRSTELFAVFAMVVCCVFVQAAVAADSSSAPIGISQAELRIRGVLQDKADLQFAGIPLKDALAYVKEKYNLDLQIDDAAVKQVKMEPAATKGEPDVPKVIDLTNAKVYFSARGLTLRPALNLILAQAGLAAIIKDDVLLVTTKENAQATLATQLYDVRDLVIRENDVSGAVDFDTLIDLIRTTVNPTSWDQAGGQGSVAGFNNGGICALVVWQNFEGQEQVEALLSKMRALRPQRILRQ
jgi:hypothetical protein